jgi:hypothetical protein
MMCLLNVKHMESDMTKREKDLQLLRNRILRLEKIRDQAIRDLVIAETRLPTLRKQAKRLADRTLAAMRQVAPMGMVSDGPDDIAAREFNRELMAATQVESAGGEDDGGIPTFLRRGQAAQAAADAAISEAARKLAALPDPRAPERKAVRKEVEKQVRQAELTGKRRKLPLTGKQALAEIDRQR